MTKYNFLDNNFTTFENVNEPLATKLELPLGEVDISDWGYIGNNGAVIANDNLASNNTTKLQTRFIVDEVPAEEVVINKNTPPDNSKVISKNEWINELANAYRELNISENGIRNLIAKNALESNYGKAALGKFNYGNITTGSSWKGDYVNGKDHDSKGRLIKNKFRSYNSIKEFAADEVLFLKRLYDFDDNDDIDTFLNKLQGGNKRNKRYAEDPKYKIKVKNLYDNINK